MTAMGTGSAASSSSRYMNALIEHGFLSSRRKIAILPLCACNAGWFCWIHASIVASRLIATEPQTCAKVPSAGANFCVVLHRIVH